MKLFRSMQKKSSIKLAFLFLLSIVTLIGCQDILEEPDTERASLPSNVIHGVDFTFAQQGTNALILYSQKATLWEDKDEIDLDGITFHDISSSEGASGSADKGSYNENNSYFTLKGSVQVDYPASNLTYQGESLLWEGDKSRISSVGDDFVVVTLGEDTTIQGSQFEADTRGGSLSFNKGADGIIQIGSEEYHFSSESMIKRQVGDVSSVSLSKNAVVSSDIFSMKSDSIVISGNPSIVVSNAPTAITKSDKTATVNAQKATFNSATGILIGEGWTSTYVPQKDLFVEGSYLKLDTKKNILIFQVGSSLRYPTEGIEASADSIILNLAESWIEFEGNTKILNKGTTHSAEVAFLNLNTMDLSLWATSGSLPTEEKKKETNKDE